jgi:hypothetical protein
VCFYAHTIYNYFVQVPNGGVAKKDTHWSREEVYALDHRLFDYGAVHIPARLSTEIDQQRRTGGRPWRFDHRRRVRHAEILYIMLAKYISDKQHGRFWDDAWSRLVLTHSYQCVKRKYPWVNTWWHTYVPSSCWH